MVTQRGWYGGKPNYNLPMHGICQGNRVGHSIWTLLSSPIIKLLIRSKGFDLSFTLPITHSNIKFSGEAFIDDSDLLQVLSALQSADLAIVSLQKAVETWQAGLKVTEEP
jgi:hypothetical protein